MQPGLFEPPRGLVPPRQRRRSETTRTRYVRTHYRHRVLCDECTAAIHRLGANVAPYPRAVRWRRIDEAGSVAKLCEHHKTEAEREGSE